MLYPPMIFREKYYAAIEEEVQRLFDELIYIPTFTILRRPLEIRNSITNLLAAVASGKVWYHDGRFYGMFTARISADLRSIGASYSTTPLSWALPAQDVPPDVKIAMVQADDRYNTLRRNLINTLGDMNIESIDRLSDAKEKYKKTIGWMEGDFNKAVAGISIPPNLTQWQVDTIAKDWGNNLDLYIKKWSGENILKLRETVQSHALDGGRAEALVKDLRDNYGVSTRKAKFLARQETALLMSKFQETRYNEMGIDEYKWSTSKDERVRPDHKVLEGKIFSWKNPPITNQKTGARNNPGEDYNCRCIAIPYRRDALHKH